MIYLRTQASENIGFGHLNRCLKLANGLNDRGKQVTFIVSEKDTTEQEIIQKNNLQNLIVPNNLSYQEEIAFYPEDCNQILIDLSHIENVENSSPVYNYITALKEKKIKSFYIDGAFKDSVFNELSPQTPDVLIQPYIGAPHFNKENMRHIAGYEYAILPASYQNSPPKIINQTAQNILITFGGSDPQNLTKKVVQILSTQNENYKIRAIIGPYFSTEHQSAIYEAGSQYKGDFQLEKNVSDLIPHYKWADISILSSGLSRYESAACGTPSLFCALYPAHIAPCEAFAQAGIARYIGLHSDLLEEDWLREINNLANDPLSRKSLSQRGQNLIDGKGLERLIKKIEAEMI